MLSATYAFCSKNSAFLNVPAKKLKSIKKKVKTIPNLTTQV